MHPLEIYTICDDQYGWIATSPDSCYVTTHCPSPRDAARLLASCHIPKTHHYTLKYISQGRYRATIPDNQ